MRRECTTRPVPCGRGGGTVWAVCRHSRHHMPSFTSGLLLHNHSHARFKGHHVYSQLQHTQAGLAHTRNPVPDLILGIWPGYLSLATITSFAPSLGLFCFSAQTLSTCELRTTATLVTGQGREGQGREGNSEAGFDLRLSLSSCRLALKPRIRVFDRKGLLVTWCSRC